MESGEIAALMALQVKGVTPVMQPLPIPHQCQIGVTTHRQDCRDPNCGHENDCEWNKAMWLTPEAQAETPYVCQFNDIVAQEQLDILINAVKDARAALTEILNQSGDKILKKWKKMSKDKRGALLHRAVPKVFSQWPLQPYMCEDCPEIHFMEWDAVAWMNAKDLSEDPMKLISAMWVRVQLPSQDWVVIDMRETRKSLEKCKELIYNPGCVAMYGPRYGRLCEYDEPLVHAWAVVGFPRAFFAFQTQKNIYEALLEIAKAIVGDMAGNGNSQLVSLAQKGLTASSSDTTWNPYLHQAFTPPAKFDIASVLEHAKSRLGMIVDEIWLMQTDPQYMQEVIKSKRVAISNNSDGLTHEDQLLHVGSVILLELINRFYTWKGVVRLCERVRDVFETTGHSQTPGQTLPSHLSSELLRLGVVVLESLKISSRNFGQVLYSTATMKGQYKALGIHGHLMIGYKAKLDFDNGADRLHFHFKALRSQIKEGLGLFGMTWRFRMIFEDKLDAEEVVRLIDKPTYDHLSDLMVLDDIATAIGWSQLGTNVRTTQKDQEIRDELKAKFESREFRYEDIRDGDGLSKATTKLRLDPKWVEPVAVSIKYLLDAPWPKGRKDLSWLEKAEESRSRLQELWQVIADEYRKAASELEERLPSAESFLSVCAFHQDPAYLSSLEEERQTCEAETARMDAIAASEVKVQQQQVPQEFVGAWESKDAVRRKQTKAKAARNAASLEQKVDELNLDDDSPKNLKHQPTSELRERIAVKKESLAVFRKMFPSGDDGLDLRGDIRWQVFLQAMKDAGMTAAEVSGSAVSFSNASGSICFHRPHPDPVIDPVMLHNMARRMNKWFGWDSETFVLRT